MRYNHLLTASAALLALASTPISQAAAATTAQVTISNVTVAISALDPEPWVTGNWPWIAQNTGPGWPATAESTGAMAELADAALHQEAIGWLGTGRDASVGTADATASASVGFAGSDLFSPGAAWSFASASNGESASAVARLWDAAFMVGARTELVLSFHLDQLSAVGAGGTASALASLSMWSSDFGGDLVSAEAQVIDSPDYTLGYAGPLNLSVTWRNSSTSMAVAQVALLTSAQALSTISAVPEPASAALLLAGLIGVGLATGRGRRAQAAM